jgi:parallel beta-helix repeat protein
MGDRTTHTGTSGEWGMGIYIGANSSNVTVQNVTINNCWGDGIYVYTTVSPSNIAINNILSDNNRRQGLSIINVDGITVTNSTFSNTQGTGPECGIDLEPNAGQHINAANINHNTLTGNHGCGLQMGGGTTTTITNVIADSNSIASNGYGARSSFDSSSPQGILVSQCLGNSSLATAPKITNNVIIGNVGAGIAFSTQAYSTVTGNTISGATLYSTNAYQGAGIGLWNTNGISMTGNTITNNATWGIWDLGYDSNVVNPGTGNLYSAGPANIYSPNTYSGNGSGNYKSGTN